MIFPQDESAGCVAMSPDGPFRTGELVTLKLTFTVGDAGMKKGARLRYGLPNTGWEAPVAPQLRYWDELIAGSARRYAPFHPVNVTAHLRTAGKGVVALETMERMLLPDEDPAEAYWRWWITATLEEADLSRGDCIDVVYGDPRFVGRAARVQTFVESGLTISAYVETDDGQWVRPGGAPIPLDVAAGPAVRANAVVPSVGPSAPCRVKVALTDECHCRPASSVDQRLTLRDDRGVEVGSGQIHGYGEIEIAPSTSAYGRIAVTDRSGNRVWGRANPSRPQDDSKMNLYWGDLHAQSEYHVMHSQKKDSRQTDWSRGISCGTPDEVYQYARDVSLLDFVAITDQGAITGVGWETLQAKAAEYLSPGKFVTFNAYEAGSPVGHRNVYYRSEEVDPRQSSESFNFMPEFLYKYYAGRSDVIMIPHHVKTWTDWSYYNADLEPVMEVYSCWGQSESPSLERWDKGMTPGAGAWEALRRGYRLGMIASSDNHVGLPGRSYPHDRQVHTPFPGGLVAVWAPELTREAVFDAIRARRCFGTTGARIILSFSVNGSPMGSEFALSHPAQPRHLAVHVAGTDALAQVEIIKNGAVCLNETYSGAGPVTDRIDLLWSDQSELPESAYYYVRVTQIDGEMAWSSPVWVDVE